MKRVRRASRVVGISVVGSLLLVAGVVMLVTPGPGLLAMAAGLAILSREFAWAHSLLERVRLRLTTPRHRRRERRPAVTDLDAPPLHHDLVATPHGHRHVA